MKFRAHIHDRGPHHTKMSVYLDIYRDDTGKYCGTLVIPTEAVDDLIERIEADDSDVLEDVS